MISKDSAVITEEMMDLLPHLIKLLFHNSSNEKFHLLPSTHLRVLLTLMKYGTMNVTHIAEHMEIQRQQLTKVLESLSNKNLVCRKENPQNRRLILIEITDEGEKYIKSLIRKKAERISEFLEGLSAEEKDILLRAIMILKNYAVVKKE